TAKHAVDNPASGAVLKKCGFSEIGMTTLTKLDGSGILDAVLYEKRV
ncbi:MAG: N-acetyltransferase, partial [Oscillospiraceae bacterium]|nr:N-acetyltransferase [Oscillospiraceae bacterium]